MTCFLCRGSMENGLTTFTTEVNGCVIIIKGVPSHICTQCGEISYSDEVAARLEEIVQQMKNSSLEIAITTYAA